MSIAKVEKRGREEGRAADIEMGKETGGEEGIQQEKLGIAKNMRRKGYSYDVKEWTGLENKQRRNYCRASCFTPQ